MTKEMYAANVKNWLMDIATGVKASRKNMQFADSKSDEAWRVTALCYQTFDGGVGIHHLKQIAEVLDVPVEFALFAKDSYLYGKYAGYWYIEMFGVKFYDFAYEEEL